jgi:hypothetical protein
MAKLLKRAQRAYWKDTHAKGDPDGAIVHCSNAFYA